MTDREGDADATTGVDESTLPSRRAVLSSIAVGTATGLAGCSDVLGGVTSVSATPTVLSPAGQEMFGVDAFDLETLTRTVSPSGVPAEVEATSYLAVHGGPDEPERLGASFGVAEPGAHALGILAMPAPELLGQELNPLAEQPFQELLVGSRGRELVSRAGILDTPDFEWQRDPTQVGTADAELLGTGTTVESYLGVVSDGATTRTLLAQFARVDHEGDVVLVGEFGWRARPDQALDADGECADEGCQLPVEALERLQTRFGAGLPYVDPCAAMADTGGGAISENCSPDIDTPPLPKIGIGDVRVVQQVEDTAVVDPDSGNVVHREPDPDYVRGEESAVVFEFDTLERLSQMTNPFEIAVFSGDAGGGGRYEREGTIRFTKGDLQGIKTKGHDTVAVLHDISNDPNRATENPVFELETGDVKLSPVIRPLQATSGVSTTVSIPAGRIRDLAPLKIGFVPLRDSPPQNVFNNKQPGDRYGTNNGLPRVTMDSFEAATEYLQRAYPGDVVTYLHQATPTPGRARPIWADMKDAKRNLDNVATGGVFSNSSFPNGGTLRLDGRNRSNVVSDIRNNGFDATVVIVPGVAPNNPNASGYYDYHGRGASGLAFGPGRAVSSNGASPGGFDQGISLIVAQEVGHYFQDDYLDPAGHPMAQRRNKQNVFQQSVDGKQVEPDHARHQNSSLRGITNDDPGVISVAYELDEGFTNLLSYRNPDGSFETFGPLNSGTPRTTIGRVPSFMSYTNRNWAVWTDSRIHQQLIDAGAGNDWVAGGTAGGGGASYMLSARGRITDDGGVRYESVRALRAIERYVDGEESPVQVELVGAAGETLASARVPLSPSPTHGAGVEARRPSFVLPFEPGGVRVRTTYEGRASTMNPVVRSVRNAVARVPVQGFADDPTAARDRVGAALDEVAAAMDAGEYADAAATMDGPVRERLGEELVAYEAALDQRTPEAMAHLVDRMVERLEAAIR